MNNTDKGKKEIIKLSIKESLLLETSGSIKKTKKTKKSKVSFSFETSNSIKTIKKTKENNSNKIKEEKKWRTQLTIKINGKDTKTWVTLKK